MPPLADLPLRPELLGLTPYGAPQGSAKVALNVNENTHGIPEKVALSIADALAKAVLTANRYPDREFTALREGLAKYLGENLLPENIWAANGSNEILQQILLAFGGPGRRALGFPPTYSMYPILARGTGTTWVTGSRDENFEISPQSAVSDIQRSKPDLVFFCSPNNPTGTALSLETIVAAYEATKAIVVVDEAYAEFASAGTPSAVSLLPGRERLLVSRTMSKAFAFAGARVGYLAAAASVTDALRLVRLPYHLSALTQAAACAALAHAPELLSPVGEIALQRDRLVEELKKLGYSPWPSAANFVLFGGVANPQTTFEELRKRDILIRDVGIPNHLRVTVGTEEETTAFLSALAELTRQ